MELVRRARETALDRQAKYKAYHDKKVRTKLDLKVGDCVFLDRPPATGQTQAEKEANVTRSKLSKKTDSQAYTIIGLTGETAKIVKDDIEDVVSLDRVSKAPPPLD